MKQREAGATQGQSPAENARSLAAGQRRSSGQVCAMEALNLWCGGRERRDQCDEGRGGSLVIGGEAAGGSGQIRLGSGRQLSTGEPAGGRATRGVSLAIHGDGSGDSGRVEVGGDEFARGWLTAGLI